MKKKYAIMIILAAIVISAVLAYVIIGNAQAAHQVAERAREGMFKGA